MSQAVSKPVWDGECAAQDADNCIDWWDCNTRDNISQAEMSDNLASLRGRYFLPMLFNTIPACWCLGIGTPGDLGHLIQLA